MNGVQARTKAAESNTENSREKARKAQEHPLPSATLALFRSCSVIVNPAHRFGTGRSSTPVKPYRWLRCGEKMCKYFTMNNLHNNRPAGESNPVKVNQTCCEVSQQQNLRRFGKRQPRRAVAAFTFAGHLRTSRTCRAVALRRRKHSTSGGVQSVNLIAPNRLWQRQFALRKAFLARLLVTFNSKIDTLNRHER